MKNIIICGAPRCGKTTLIRELLKHKPSVDVIMVDALRDCYFYARSLTMKKEFTKEGKLEINIDENSLFNEDILCEYINLLYEKLMKNHFNRPIIIDFPITSVDNIYKYFHKDFDIYCLGMPNEKPYKLFKIIREKETKDDWTNLFGDNLVYNGCHMIIDESKRNKEQCQKYDIPFFDTSGNRYEKLEKINNIIIENTKL